MNSTALLTGRLYVFPEDKKRLNVAAAYKRLLLFYLLITSAVSSIRLEKPHSLSYQA